MKTFALYSHSRLNNIDALLKFYDNHFTSLRFLNYIGRQCADIQMINIFVTGGKKYLKREFKQVGRDAKRGNPKRREKKKEKKEEKTKKRKLKPFEQDNQIPLVASRDSVFSTRMKGTIPGLARRLTNL